MSVWIRSDACAITSCRIAAPWPRSAASSFCAHRLPTPGRTAPAGAARGISERDQTREREVAVALRALDQRRCSRTRRIARPAFPAVLTATSRSPRSTSTSVTGSANTLRREIASRCSWLLVLRALDQGRVVEPLGLRQHRSRDLDRVVEREPAHHPRRRVGDASARRWPKAARADDVDLLDQAAHARRRTARSARPRTCPAPDTKQIGHAPQGLGALPDVRLRERVLELIDQVLLRTS